MGIAQVSVLSSNHCVSALDGCAFTAKCQSCYVTLGDSKSILSRASKGQGGFLEGWRAHGAGNQRIQ